MLAGIPDICVSRVVAEPIAGVFAIFHDKYCDEHLDVDEVFSETYMVSDMGGGTYDVTIVTFELRFLSPDDEKPTLTVRVFAVAGDNLLGGADFTRALAVSDC